MSEWAKKQGEKLDRYILQDRIAELRSNPYEAVAVKHGLEPDDPQLHRLAEPHVKAWVASNRCSAYIFGDTYEGMPIDEALKIIIDMNFRPIGRIPNGLIRFKHDCLGIALTPRCDDDGKLTCIPVDVALAISPDLVKTSDFCGLGLCDPQVLGKTLHAQMDATDGFRVKMAGLRRIASAGFNDIKVS